MKIPILLFGIFLLFSPFESRADDLLLIDLSGSWNFRLGDHITWRNIDYNDEGWESIPVPSSWQASGYDHTGYAWYRMKFDITEDLTEIQLVLIAGKIGDADQVFLNGQSIGSTGKFPPDPRSASDSLRVYIIPSNVLKLENVIAIRVYNIEGIGGIFEGPVGISRYDNR